MGGVEVFLYHCLNVSVYLHKWWLKEDAIYSMVGSLATIFYLDCAVVVAPWLALHTGEWNQYYLRKQVVQFNNPIYSSPLHILASWID